MNSRPASNHPNAFTLVELLVVIGIIAIMIGLLMPALSRARAQANSVVCASNLRQIGVSLQIYSELWKGYVYPPGLGANRLPNERWPVHVFKMKYPDTKPTSKDDDARPWQPKIMICPQDPEPLYDHSYVLNDHLADAKIKFSSKDLGGLTPSDVIVIGEKKSNERDYYMNIRRSGAEVHEWSSDFDRLVEPYRHGVRLGSNYLHLDWSVSNKNPIEARKGVDPWDTGKAAATQPS